MATVFIPPLLRAASDGARDVIVEGRTLGDVIVALETRFPELRGKLRDGDSVASGLAADVDGALAEQGLLTPVGPDSEIHFLPAIAGGKCQSTSVNTT